jgi:hypothetical protein
VSDTALDEIRSYLLNHLTLEVADRSNDPDDSTMILNLLVDGEVAASVDLPE